MQSFFVNVPFKIEDEIFECSEYWDNDKYTKLPIKKKK